MLTTSVSTWTSSQRQAKYVSERERRQNRFVYPDNFGGPLDSKLVEIIKTLISQMVAEKSSNRPSATAILTSEPFLNFGCSMPYEITNGNHFRGSAEEGDCRGKSEKRLSVIVQGLARLVRPSPHADVNRMDPGCRGSRRIFVGASENGRFH